MADYAITRDWAPFATIRYKQLLGGAADSHIVASAGIKYRF